MLRWQRPYQANENSFDDPDSRAPGGTLWALEKIFGLHFDILENKREVITAFEEGSDLHATAISPFGSGTDQALVAGGQDLNDLLIAHVLDVQGVPPVATFYH